MLRVIRNQEINLLENVHDLSGRKWQNFIERYEGEREDTIIGRQTECYKGIRSPLAAVD